jgi:hypothetical protein
MVSPLRDARQNPIPGALAQEPPQNVFTDLVRSDEATLDRRGTKAPEHRHPTVSEHFARLEQVERVPTPAPQETREHRGTALDEDAAQTQPREGVERRLDRHTRAVHGATHDLTAPGFDGALPLARRLVRGEHDVGAPLRRPTVLLRQAQPRVEDDRGGQPEPLLRIDQAAIEGWVIHQNGVDAHENAVVQGSHLVDEPARGHAGDVVTPAGRARDLAVDGRGHLERDCRLQPQTVLVVAEVLDRGDVPEAPDVDLHPGAPQRRDPAAVDVRVGVERRHHDARYTALQDSLDARWRSPVVRAGFEGNVERRATRRTTGCVERDDLRVGLSAAFVVALADDRAVAHDHRPHHRIGRGLPGRAPRQVERAPHVRLVHVGRSREVAPPRGLEEMLGELDSHHSLGRVVCCFGDRWMGGNARTRRASRARTGRTATRLARMAPR